MAAGCIERAQAHRMQITHNTSEKAPPETIRVRKTHLNCSYLAPGRKLNEHPTVAPRESPHLTRIARKGPRGEHRPITIPTATREAPVKGPAKMHEQPHSTARYQTRMQVFGTCYVVAQWRPTKPPATASLPASPLKARGYNSCAVHCTSRANLCRKR